MSGFLLNRLSQSVVLLVIVSIIGFTVLNLMPGGPLAQFGLDPGMTQADIDNGRLICIIGLAVVKPGARTGDIGAAIQAFAEAERCSVVRDFCGHGLGRVFHDAPSVPRPPGTGRCRAGEFLSHADAAEGRDEGRRGGSRSSSQL